MSTTNANLIEKANQIIQLQANASFGVIDENGYPSVSAISLCNPETIATLYFTTTLDSNKAKRLTANSKASINAFTDANNITLVGKAEILTDQDSKNKYWKEWFCEVYAGPTDPNYCVIQFTTERVSLWIGEDGGEFPLA
ncbi:MAG: pyridoxamine 5'-phosphate oxidase family protein [Oscillospiraceae bacterium]|nr:pyridoxamine 5'-phosphate oxidase family protein [Oscillospiraceae bacterium]